MDAHERHSRLRRPGLSQLAITLLAALVLATGFAVSAAQSTDGPGQPEASGREFENTIPAHVPLKVKLRNEQAFKDKKNKEWGRDLEIEVKNTGTKPIYFMYMVVDLPDFVLDDGNPVGFQVRYGRSELVLIDTPVLPDDVPILPGESVTLKIRESSWEGYKAIRDKKRKADPKKVRFGLQLVNFGDGTGLQGMTGTPTPNLTTSRKEGRREYSQLSRDVQLPTPGPLHCFPPVHARGHWQPHGWHVAVFRGSARR